MSLPFNAQVLLTVAALLICYAGTIRGMVYQWSTDADMGHGFLVPVVVLWIIWRERDAWRSQPARPTKWGWAVLAVAAAMQTLGAVGGGLFAESVGFLLSLIGVVLILGGFSRAKAWAFPLLLSLFMLPKLAIVYNQATLPLQLVASRLAASMLTTARVAVIRDGNILDIAGHRISVAEACDGIRYLLPLGFMALVVGYLTESKPWLRTFLLVAAIPIAVLANAMRVAVTGYWPVLTDGTPHLAIGWVIFGCCVAMIFAVHSCAQSVEAKYRA